MFQCAILSGQMVFACANAGPTEMWGQPANLDNYSQDVYIDALTKFDFKPDFVFVDGRFRVATALKSIESSKNDSVLLIHDYHNRERYWDLETFFDVRTDYVKGGSVMGVFKKKQNIDQTQLESHIKKYTNNPSR